MPVTAINQNISELQLKVQRKEKLFKHLEYVQNRIRGTLRFCNSLEIRFEKEQKDVFKLQNLSLQNLVGTILGDKEARLEKERQEMFDAKLQYDRSYQTWEAYREEEKAIKKELSLLGNPVGVLEALLKEKAILLNTMPHSQQTRLQILDNQVHEIEQQYQELSEAYMVGKQVIKVLKRIDAYMSEAGNWGTYDMFGGGIIATSMKRGKIDSARSEIEHNQALFEKYQKELSDINVKDMLIDFSGFDFVADTFLDNIFTDWFVQGKIQESKGIVKQNLQKAQKVQLDISAKKAELSDSLKFLKEEIKYCISIAE